MANASSSRIKSEMDIKSCDTSSGTVINDELDYTLDCSNSNGWDANDMFNRNEVMYGVQSTFDPSLRGYTSQLENRDDAAFKNDKKRAELIAGQIESHTKYKESMDFENSDDDEETRFAAVQRPCSKYNSPHGGKEECPVSNSEKHVLGDRKKHERRKKKRKNPPINNDDSAPLQSPQAVPTMEIQSKHGGLPSQYVQQQTHNQFRPHTPQQFVPQGHYPRPGQKKMQSTTFIMPQPATFQPQHPHAGQPPSFWQGNNYVQLPQMQVAATAGQPLLAPAPIQHFVQFPTQHPQHYHQQMVYKPIRMFNETTQQPQLQYLAPTPPSTTPSPGQPHQQHQQYHIPQPSTAGGGPQYAQTTTQGPQFQMICPLITTPIPQYYQGAGQPQHYPPQFQVLMSQQHPAQ